MPSRTTGRIATSPSMKSRCVASVSSRKWRTKRDRTRTRSSPQTSAPKSSKPVAMSTSATWARERSEVAYCGSTRPFVGVHTRIRLPEGFMTRARRAYASRRFSWSPRSCNARRTSRSVKPFTHRFAM